MLLIRLDEPSARAQYAVRHLLSRFTGWAVEFAGSEEEFRSSALPKFRYGNPVPGETEVVAMQASGGMGAKGEVPPEPPMGRQGLLPICYPAIHGGDPIAGSFYLLSRAEEFAPRRIDAHGRLPSADHFMVRHGMEQLPVVDYWALQLAETMCNKYPGLPTFTRRYRHVLTVDVDNGLQILGRPAWKQGGALARALIHGDLSEVGIRMRVLTGRRPDPFAQYNTLVNLAQTKQVDRLIAFMLMRGGSRYNHAANARHPALHSQLLAMDRTFEVGLHPSYQSSANQQVFAEDRNRLEGLLGHPIRVSRQHFLRWRVPNTLHELEQAGIQEDHSAGFSDRPGFRCGTCTPFPWYHLAEERETELMLWPFAAMDSALHDHLGLEPEQAVRQMNAYSDAVRAVGGTFISVWHDRFLSGHGQWVAWPAAMAEVVAHAK